MRGVALPVGVFDTKLSASFGQAVGVQRIHGSHGQNEVPVLVARKIVTFGSRQRPFDGAGRHLRGRAASIR